MTESENVEEITQLVLVRKRNLTNMEPVTRQLLLAKDKTAHFIWAGKRHCSTAGYQGSAILYETNAKDCKLSMQESNQETSYIREISSAIEQSILLSPGRSSIDMNVRYDGTKKEFDLSIRIAFEEDLVNKLLNLISEPKVAIKCTFDKTFPFCIPATNLTTVKTVHVSDGAEGIINHIKGHAAPYNYHINCTIYLEWQDFDVKSKQERCALLDKLFSEKLLADCCIVTKDQKEVSCHRNVLAGNSEVIHDMLTSGQNGSTTNRIEMTEITEEVVNLFLSYLYGQEINTQEINEDTAFQLLCTAHEYKVFSLEELMVVTIFNKPNDSFPMTTVLAVYHFTINKEEFSTLCSKMVNIMKRNPEKLLSSSAYEDLLERRPKEASELALKLMQLTMCKGSNQF